MHQTQLLPYQDQVEDASFPFLHGFLAVTCNIVLDFPFLHERGQNGLINGVV